MFKLIIKNNITLFNTPSELIDLINSDLVIKNPDYIKKERMNKWLGSTSEYLSLFIKKGETYILPFGYYEFILDYFKKIHYKDKISIETHFSPLNLINLKEKVELYPYQENTLNSLLNAKNGCLLAPCGSGKTRIGLALIKALGLKALWLTHTKDLLNQSKENAEFLFTSEKETFGTITEGKVNIGSTITFATVQTLSKIDPKIYDNEFNVVIVDEAHHLAGTPTQATMFYKVINSINARYKFGLSATYKRSDGLINTVFYNLGKIKHTISEKEVAKYRVEKTLMRQISITKDYDLCSYTFSDGMVDYNKLINMLVCDNARNKQIIDNIIKNKDKYQIVLSLRVEHLNILERMLNAKNIKTFKVDALTKNRDFTNLNNDKKILLATFQLAKEGLDIPKLEVLHITLPIKDEVALIQSIGRIQRKSQNKKEAIIYDYLDTNIAYCLGAYKKRISIYKKNNVIL